jgi:hypothetical protein
MGWVAPIALQANYSVGLLPIDASVDEQPMGLSMSPIASALAFAALGNLNVALAKKSSVISGISEVSISSSVIASILAQSVLDGLFMMMN